jgi:hypothetical protein
LWLKTKAVELIIRNKSTQNWKKILLHIILIFEKLGGDREYVGQILQKIFNLYFVVQNFTDFSFFLYKYGNMEIFFPLHIFF